MSSQEEWLLSQVAPTSDALAAGDGCHPDEAKALSDYLNGILTAHDAARHITGPVSLESDPLIGLGRLWGLLCEALVELGHEERQKTLDLLAAVQILPSTPKIDWSQLPNLGHMWNDLYRLHFHGRDSWEKESLTDERTAELRRYFDAIGTVEAEMYVRALSCVTEDWGYSVLSLVCSERAGLDILLNEVYSWLKVAGTKLKQSMNPHETKSYSREVVGSHTQKWQAVSRTMAEHWAAWEKALLDFSGDHSTLSAEGSRLAADCLVLMR